MAIPSASSELDATPATTSERRSDVRYACKLEINWGTDSTQTAVVRDISAGGIGLVVNEAIPRGTAVTVQLRNEAEGVVFSKPLRVKYARNEGTGSWSIGGSFERPLSKKEMKQLLHETAMP